MKKAKKRKQSGAVICLVTLWVGVIGDRILRTYSIKYATLLTHDLSHSNWWRADLKFADLTGMKLQGASFDEANMFAVKLTNADCTKAQFRFAGLSMADLRNAKLQHADLSSSMMLNTNLRGADLSSANLEDAYLLGADLRDTNLSGAVLKGCGYNKDTQWPTGFDPKKKGAELSTDPTPQIEPFYWGITKGVFDK